MGTRAFRYGEAAGVAGEIATVRAIYDAFERRQVDGVLPFIAEDFELLPVGTAQLIGRTEPYRGPDGMREYLADIERAWSELKLQADDIRAIAGSVVVFGRVDGVEGRSGARVERRVLWTWKLRAGKAVSLRVNDVGA